MITSLVAAIGLNPLLFLERRRSARPSDLASLYLFGSILCDVMLLSFPSETLWSTGIWLPVFIRGLLHSIVLAIETWGPRPNLKSSAEPQPREELSSSLGSAIFAWITPIVWHGYKNIMGDEDLPDLSRDLKPKVTRQTMLRAWDQRGSFPLP